MHEVKIMQNALSVVFAQVEPHKCKAVTVIELSVGSMSGVLPDALMFAFEALKVGTLVENCELIIDLIFPRYRCNSCQDEFYSEEFIFECVRCNRPVEVCSFGDDLFIKRICYV